MDEDLRGRARRAVDALGTSLPNSVVRWAAARSAPMARLSGKTSIGSAALGKALVTLAQPPTRLWSRSATGTVDDAAGRLDRSSEEVARWRDAGMLSPDGTPREVLDRDAFDRAALIDLALRSGADEQSLARAAANGNLIWAALESVLTAGGSMTGQQIADSAGVEFSTLSQIWGALGLPTGGLAAASFNRRDVHAVRTLGALGTVFSSEDMEEASSVIGRAMAEISSAMVDMVRRRIAEPLLEAGGTDTDVVVRLAAIRDLLVPTLAPLLEITLERHLDSAIRADMSVRMEELIEPGTGHRVMAVGFADLVGFTTASERLTPAEVRNLAARLHRIADLAVADHGGRVVKSIGDAVMFTAAGQLQAARAALEIVAAVDSDDALPPVRAGVAYGPVLPGYADYFGRTVNLASRLCGAAAAGQVLLHADDRHSDDAWAEAGIGVTEEDVGELKGITGHVAAVSITPQGR